MLISMLMFRICTVYYPVTKASNCVAVVDVFVLLWLIYTGLLLLRAIICGSLISHRLLNDGKRRSREN